MKKNNFIKTIDLFAGVGGIRLGFEKYNFKTVFSNDIDKKCAETYNLNFSNPKLVIEDIKKINLNAIPDCEFLLGGFPCQAFSIAGHRQGFYDEKGRGNLFFDIINIMKNKNIQGFLLENVKNLISHDKGNTFKIITTELEKMGFYINYKVLNTMLYGAIPQNRERIYIVGFKNKKLMEAFSFPKEIPLLNSVSNLLEGSVDDKYYYNNKPLFKRLQPYVKDKNKVYQWRRQYVRENKKYVCPTLTANMGTGGHNVPIILDNKGIRKLTPRECFRLQGFPDSFQLPKLADSHLYKQIGNSVSVSVIERIANNINIAINAI